MAWDGQKVKPRVFNVDSELSWDFFIARANNQAWPVVAHFTASWCMPSVAMNSFFAKMALSYQDILFLLVDVDEVKELASKMEIKAMPTFVFMREGKVIDKVIGANPNEIKKWINASIN